MNRCEKGGIIMTTFKCPFCNANLPIPDRGTLLLCEYCNAPIKAIDIFEKIKALLE
jgi:primosomal protein N'